MLEILQLDRHPSARPAVALLMALILGVVSSGFPLPSGTKVVTERFPCEDSPCGCRTTEQCWNNCCCHSPAERLAWAEREGVAPPPSALAQAKTATTSCCAKKRCCSSSTAEDAPGPESHNDRAKPTTDNDLLTVGWRALACQGHTAGFLVATLALVVTPDQLTRPHQCRWLGPIPSEVALSGSLQPPQPPPQPHLG